MPTSCEDLQRIGHTLSGFFLVKGSMKMETVYCNFYSDGYGTTCSHFLVIACLIFLYAARQELIGYADVKSTPVYFYVQRKAHYETRWFTSIGTPITYELTQVNEGNAMDLPSGIFTAPRQGTYYFAFTALAKFSASSSLLQFKVFQYLNGGRIGTGYVSEANTIDNQWSPLTLQSTLKLGKGDQVWLAIFGMSANTYLMDGGGHYNHFNGFIMQEEIVASL